MKRLLAILIIFVVASVVVMTTATFIRKSVTDQYATWRLAPKAWHYLAAMPARDRQAAVINVIPAALNIAP